MRFLRFTKARSKKNRGASSRRLATRSRPRRGVQVAPMRDAELEGRRRVIVEQVRPWIDGGRFPIKRAVGDRVEIEADAFVDGHDRITVRLLHRREGMDDWHAVPMEPCGNDTFRASFLVTEVGRAFYTVEAWVDAFSTWREALRKKVDAGQDVRVELLDGGRLVAAAAARASGTDATVLTQLARDLEGELGSVDARIAAALDDAVALVIARNPDRRFATRWPQELEIVVDPPEAVFSAWYELFPRSTGANGRHGTFRDAERLLPYVQELGFDTLYLPPIHPIGRAFRKGPNNTLDAGPNDPGSPWAIGAAEGGHTAVHPELGTLDDLKHFVGEAERHGLRVAIDIAFQASPDHPWVREHP